MEEVAKSGMDQKYQKFLDRIRELNAISYTQELMMWDQETYMPPKGTHMRAKAQGTMAGIYHEKFTDPDFVALVRDLKAMDLKGDPAVNVREIYRKQQRAVKIPCELVVQLSDTETQAYEAWLEAKRNTNFTIFSPWLKKIVSLQRKIADLVGYEGTIYNALLQFYEPDIRAEEIAPLFASLRNHLILLLEKILEKRPSQKPKIFQQEFPIEKQDIFNRRILKDMGFDLEGGRLDVAVHPFCAGFCPGDVRITTSYRNDDWPESLFSTLHEAGHGLYDQGLPKDAEGTPAGQSISPAIHESQSRLWENIIGRSREFWHYYLPPMRELFPEQLKNGDENIAYAAVNYVTPSLIRAESDEVTYNLHILLRFELEKEMMEGNIQIEDLPSIWNERMEKYLGIRPDNDARGVLQDVHWSFGMIGYFPTYTLGNLYCAQFFHQVQKEIPDLMARIAQGQLVVLKEWLNRKIHSRGSRVTGNELVREVTGEPLQIDYFIDYLKNKFLVGFLV